MQKYSARLSRAKNYQFLLRYKKEIGAREQHFSRWTEEGNVQRPAMASRGTWRLLCSHHVVKVEIECQCGEGWWAVVIFDNSK